jgi:hypothetical protein
MGLLPRLDVAAKLKVEKPLRLFVAYGSRAVMLWLIARFPLGRQKLTSSEIYEYTPWFQRRICRPQE